MAGAVRLAEFVTSFGDTKRFPDAFTGGID